MPSRRFHPRAWSASVAIVVGVACVDAAFAWTAEAGPSPSFAVVADRASSDRERLGPGLHVAGSGANIGVTRRLAEAYARAHPGSRIVVHESIGSTGGARAAADGAVAIGLVSRPLNARERALELEVVPYARVPVVFAVHPDVADGGLTRAQVLDLYAGRLDRWGDGTPVVVLLRERGDSSHLAVAVALDGFREVTEDALQTRRFRVLYRDDALLDVVGSVRGAVGLSDLAAVRASADRAPKVLAIDGVAPSLDSIADGSYPFFKDLSFVLRHDANPEARRFVGFAHSEEGRSVLSSSGCVPLAPGTP